MSAELKITTANLDSETGDGVTLVRPLPHAGSYY